MTLHWWMHWFWITRPLAVATQLIFLLAAVQTVPLPASTLDPQVHSSHNSRTPPATSWISGNDPTVTNGRPTSVYIEQHRQTAVYEGGPVWSSSPDIEEPFYPTTASSDHMSNRDLPTENIPITQKTISSQELVSETYRLSSAERPHQDYGKPTEFSLQSYSQQTTKLELTVQNSRKLGKVEKENVLQSTGNKQSVNSVSYLNREVPILEEPRALPLELSPVVTSENEFFSSTALDLENSTPKKIDDSISQKDSIFVNANHDHQNFIKNSSFSQNSSIGNGDALTRNRKLSQRLVIRDLRNASEPVLLSILSSHGSNSTDLGNSTLVRQSVRGSKAIGSFPHSSAAAGSSETKKEHVANPDKVEEDKSVQNPINIKENRTLSKEGEVNSDVKILHENSEPIKGNHSIINHNTSLLSKQNNSKSHSVENVNEQPANRRVYIESGSSKLASDSNRTNLGISVNSSIKASQPDKEGSQTSTVNSSFQNVTPNPVVMSTIGVGRKESSSPEPSVPFDSSLSQRITTLSDTEEAINLTPLHTHEFIGRSASHSHDVETTVEPSVAPVSGSRVAASPPDIPHRGLDAASITGIALGIVVFAGLTGAVSFILYRRRYLNKPQTLNDKCSNPDSSGYIDDSTLRENSEEMYSLDNDSFLNSLEAMTIQNYWTDNQETCWRQNRP
ncbi:hypothetical protein R5R35_013483 [Gryllus longicercus]|uniref:Uncharacterized protein n=1 Tax=Gryllus longicercus TaxID=2509291 RepID=A0AAN9VE85_9ORTH